MENLRPTFLTVLCILTFIGSAMGIYSSFTNYTAAGVASGVTQDLMDEMKDKIDEEAQDEKSAEMANKIFDAVGGSLTEDNIRNNALGGGIASVLTLVGAVLMWGLNKKGFYIYLIGTVVGIIVPIVIYKGLMGAIAGAGTAFFGIIFAILYFVNLKHLR